MEPVLQVALDFLNLNRALKVAEEAVAGGVDWLEAGTPLIKSEGLDSIRELRKKFPRATIVADMKIMDVGRMESEAAAKAGANIVCVLGAASDATIRECVYCCLAFCQFNIINFDRDFCCKIEYNFPFTICRIRDFNHSFAVTPDYHVIIKYVTNPAPIPPIREASL